MKSSNLLLACVAGAAAILSSQVSSATETKEATNTTEAQTNIPNLEGAESARGLMELSLARRMRNLELDRSNVRINLEVTSKGKTITSSGLVVNGSALALGSVEKRKYIKSISYVDGVKTEEIEGTVDLGEQIEVRPKILPDGSIATTISFFHSEPTPGSKALPPLYFQDYGQQTVYQTLTLKSGEPAKIASLSKPGSEHDLSLTITATLEP